MSLSPIKTTVGGTAPVFAKVFELFTGGFSITTTGFNTGVTLPAGSLLKVSESARTATLVKTAKLTTNTEAANDVAKTFYVSEGHHFAVGDHIGWDGQPHQEITAIESNSTGIKVTATGATAAAVATGVVIFESGTGVGTATVKTVANALSAYDTTIESGGFVAALRRGTAYKNRVQPHVAGHLADINASIQFSESY